MGTMKTIIDEVLGKLSIHGFVTKVHNFFLLYVYI